MPPGRTRFRWICPPIELGIDDRIWRLQEAAPQAIRDGMPKLPGEDPMGYGLGDSLGPSTRFDHVEAPHTRDSCRFTEQLICGEDSVAEGVRFEPESDGASPKTQTTRGGSKLHPLSIFAGMGVTGAQRCVGYRRREQGRTVVGKRAGFGTDNRS